jgi:hypothetical protein
VSAVTTKNLLPSIHAPVEGERVRRLDGTYGTILSPESYSERADAWYVMLRGVKRTVAVIWLGNEWREV